MSQEGFEMGTFGIQIRRVTASRDLLGEYIFTMWHITYYLKIRNRKAIDIHGNGKGKL
jgi:hypothetical protein